MTQQVSETSDKDLKIEGLLERVGTQARSYEDTIANLRVELTKLNQAYQQVNQKLQNFQQSSEPNTAANVPQEQVYTPEPLPSL